MFYPGKVLKLAPADSREDKRKIVRESFQYHFRKKYAKSFVVSSIPSTINEKVDLKCKQCGQVTIRRAESIVKGTFSGNCAYCCLHDSKKAENPRKKLKNIISKKLNLDNKLFDIIYICMILILFVLSVCYIVKGSYNPFIYFNF